MLPSRQQELPPGIPSPRAPSLDTGLVPNARTWEALQCAWKGPVSPKWILQMTEACPKHPHLTKQNIYRELSKSALFMMSGPSEEEGSPRWGAQLCDLTCVTAPAIRAHVGHHVTSAIFPPLLLPEPSQQWPDVPGTAHTFGPTVPSARSISAFCTTHPLTPVGSVPTFRTPVSGKVPLPLKGTFIWASHVPEGHGKELRGLMPQVTHLYQASPPRTPHHPTHSTCLTPVSSHLWCF